MRRKRTYSIRRVPIKMVMQRTVVRRRGKHMVYQRDTGRRILSSVRGPKSPRLVLSYSLFDLAS